MTEQIQVGFTVGPGEPVYMAPSHTILTGMTGHGKTALVQALSARWRGQKFCVFIVKDAEEQFQGLPRIRPFYKQRSTSDWRPLRDLIEVSEERRLRKDEEAILAQLTPGTKTLEDILRKVEDRVAALERKKQTESYRYNLLFLLREYLRKLIQDIAVVPLTDQLELKEGINVMDLSTLPRVTQAAVIGATLAEIHKNHRETSPVIPEAWLFLPGDRGSPALEPGELIVRQGRVKHNYLIIDTQDLAGVNGKKIRTNIHNYFLGRQQYDHEVERTLGALSIPNSEKPKPDKIMRLQQGQFYAVLKDEVKLVYAWPVWKSEAEAKDIAMGISGREVDGKPPLRKAQEGDPARDEQAQRTVTLQQFEELVNDIKYKDAKIESLITIGVEEKRRADAGEEENKRKAQLLDQYEKEITQLRALAQAFTGLRDFVDQRINESLDGVHAGPSAASINLEDSSAKITIKDAKEPLSFDPDSVEARICLLQVDGYFEEGHNPKDVQQEYARHWPMKKTDHPSDTKHCGDWRKRELEPVLEMLTQRRYQVLIKDGAVYLEGPNKVKRENEKKW